MASRLVKAWNRTYKTRHVRKPQKGIGIYADQLPGLARGIHSDARSKDGRNLCRCGRCSQKTAAA